MRKLSLVILSVLFFTLNPEVSAHDFERHDRKKTYTHPEEYNVTAMQVEMAETMEKKEELTKKLLLHYILHFREIEDDQELIESDHNNPHARDLARNLLLFTRAGREKGKDFHYGETYVIEMDPERYNILGHVAPFHTKHLYHRYSEYKLDREPLRTLKGVENLDDRHLDSEDILSRITCAGYRYKDKDRVACGIRRAHSEDREEIFIAGFYHSEDDVESDIVRPDCSLVPPPEVTAREVEEARDPDTKKDLLKRYVDGTIKAVFDPHEGLTAVIGVQLLAGGVPLEEIPALVPGRVDEYLTCFTEERFKYGSIYLFMVTPAGGVVLFNGLDFDLHGLSSSLIDPNPIHCEENILTAFISELTDGTGDLSKLEDGNNAFVQYHWSNPLTPEDRVHNYLERNEVPGTSVKESYITVLGGALVGSGIYLGEDDVQYCKKDDGGCAVAGPDKVLPAGLLAVFLLLGAAVYRMRRA